MTSVLAFSPLAVLGLASRDGQGAPASRSSASGLGGDDGRDLDDGLDLSVDDLSRARWERMTEAAGAPLQQSWAYGEALQALGAGVLRARLRERRTGRDVALAQFILRRWMGRPRLALASRGPVWLTPLSAEQQRAAFVRLRTAPQLGAAGMAWPRLSVLSPDVGVAVGSLAAAGLTRVYTGPTLAELDLRPSEDRLRAAMHVKWRNRLKAAERSGLRVSISEPRFDSYGWVLDADAAQQSNRGYVALPPAFVSLYHQIAGGASVRLAVAEEDGKRAAAMLFLRHGRRATYHIGWSGPLGRRNGAHNLLLWRAMLALKADGVDAVDLGGVDTRTGAGLARFKLGAGGRPVPLAGAYL